MRREPPVPGFPEGQEGRSRKSGGVRVQPEISEKGKKISPRSGRYFLLHLFKQCSDYFSAAASAAAFFAAISIS